jgi:hypothetical protein|tara:strand:+ start:213 stop:389 length:177 start_codon:yes stop_codon:yes gene_type:complete
MPKFKIRDVEKHMIEIYEVEADTKEEALDKYVNELAGSLELVDSCYDPDVEDVIEVID